MILLKIQLKLIIIIMKMIKKIKFANNYNKMKMKVI